MKRLLLGGLYHGKLAEVRGDVPYWLIGGDGPAVDYRREKLVCGDEEWVVYLHGEMRPHVALAHLLNAGVKPDRYIEAPQ